MRRYLYLPVGGTRVNPFKAITGLEWRNAGSKFDLFARHYGFDRVDLDDDPTTRDKSIWSRAVNGLMLQALYGGHKRHWEKGGSATLQVHQDEWMQERERANREKRQPRPMVWFTHSHAGNCAFCALSRPETKGKPDLVPAGLVSLDMPVSRMMGDCYRQARELHPELPIIHIHSSGLGWHSRFRWLGSHFNDEQLAVADLNLSVDGGHGRFLRNNQYLGEWPRLFPEIRSLIGERIANG